MERDDERTAFAKACAYLNYSRAAQWTAHAAGVGSCLMYVALLAVLWLFADLMVSRGRLPTYHDVPPAAQVRFLNEWKDLPGGDLTSPVSSAAATIAGQMADPSGQGPLAAAASAAAAHLEKNERMAQLELAGYDEAESLRLASLAPAPDMDPADLDALWRADLASVMHQSVNVPDASLQEMLRRNRYHGDNYHEVDHGLLSLVVRSHLNNEWTAPAVAWVARWNPWLWNVSPDAHSLFPLHLTGLLLLAVVLALLGTFLMLLMYEMAARAVIEAAHRFRRAVYHHTFRLGTLAFRALGPSEAVSVFTRHIEAVHDALYARMTVTSARRSSSSCCWRSRWWCTSGWRWRFCCSP